MSDAEISTYWVNARADLKTRLLPLAKKTKCFPASATLDSLEALVRGFEEDDPKRVIAVSFDLLDKLCDKGDVLAKLHADLSKICLEQPEPGRTQGLAVVDEKILPNHQELVVACNRARDWVSGFLHAMDMTNKFRVSRGAKVRRTQGDVTRERIRKEARGYRHLPRDTAAALIAEAVGKSPGTIRRHLSQIFPGDDWYESIDSSQHIK